MSKRPDWLVQQTHPRSERMTCLNLLHVFAQYASGVVPCLVAGPSGLVSLAVTQFVALLCWYMNVKVTTVKAC